MLKEKETYNNKIPLLKFINKNDVNQIISTYPINNYPDSKKIKENNLTELIIPIEYNNYVEKFTTEEEIKEEIEEELEFRRGPRGEPGYTGPAGENAKPCISGSQGPPGPSGKPGVDCIPCEDGIEGDQGEPGVGIKDSNYDSNTGKIKFNYTNGEFFETDDIRGPKGDKGEDCGKGDQGPPGPAGAAPLHLFRNHHWMHLPYINIQVINTGDPWIYTLANNCFLIAHIHEDDRKAAFFYRFNNDYKKLGYPNKVWEKDSSDGGDDSGIVAIGKRDDGSIWFNLEDYDSDIYMTVISFWWD